jgi:hypothetical protein
MCPETTVTGIQNYLPGIQKNGMCLHILFMGLQKSRMCEHTKRVCIQNKVLCLQGVCWFRVTFIDDGG